MMANILVFQNAPQATGASSVLQTLVRSFFVFLIAVASAHAQSMSTDNLKSRAVWTASNLDLTIDLTQVRPTYHGTMVLRTSEATANGPVLILNNNNLSMEMQELLVTGPNAAESTATVVLSLPHPDDSAATLHAINFDPSLQGLREIEVSFRYQFTAEQGQVLQRDRLSYASWVTAWYPTPIENSDGFLSRQSLSIPGKTTFVIPESWNALSNGKLVVDRREGKTRTQTWRLGSDVARSYVAAPYKVSSVSVGDVDIRMYMLDAEQVDIDRMGAKFAEIIGVLEARFGEYPYDTFALAEIPDNTTDYFGASSEQGFIVAESKNFIGDAGTPLFAHEAAHSWWGNSFGCTGGGSALCTEALAQMGAILAIETLDGQDALKAFMDVSTPDFTNYASARGYFSVWRSGADVAIQDLDGGWRVHRLMDSKGMWFWQMLRHEIGDALFFKTLKELPNQGRSFTLDELEQFFDQRTESDLRVFFDQWLGRTGAPVISMKWENPIGSKLWDYIDTEVESLVTGEPEGRKRIEVSLTQEQEELYKLKLPIQFQFFYGPPVIKIVEVDEREEAFVFEFDENIKDVVLDPDHRVLMWRPAYGPVPRLN
jgi:hypothetical protein